MHPIIRFEGHVYSSYAALTYISFIVACVYLFYAGTKAEKLPMWSVMLYLFLIYFVQMVGGWLIPAVYKWFAIGPFPLSHLPRKGRYFHSVLLSSILFTIIYAKIFRWPVYRFLDQFAIAAAIMSAIGRVGCFLHGCCSGKPTGLPWALKFQFSEDYVHPTQLYHVFFEFLILLPALFYIQKKKTFDGATFWSFAFLYSVFRFVNEFFRTNPVAWNGLTHAQLFSAFVVVLSGPLLIRKMRSSGSRT